MRDREGEKRQTDREIEKEKERQREEEWIECEMNEMNDSKWSEMNAVIKNSKLLLLFVNNFPFSFAMTVFPLMSNGPQISAAP